ncbi:Ig-like domain-containing protein [Hyalangium minutum]|uniref:SbsA Ig-like domain-containing protein n=1 Tax=Hyalangium minutum TaxID=394096 RepID=A0A085W430_9BACT|nr:hypothetical protein DB31_4153 [Hyalangium minutum]
MSEAREVVVDRTPPQVLLRQPSPGAQQVSVHEPIGVTFSESIDPAVVTDSQVHLLLQTSGSPIELAKTLSLSSGGTELTITPSSQPNAPNEFSVNLSALRDRAGNAVADSGTWNWKYPAWLPMGGSLSHFADEGSAVSSPAESPALTLDSRGNPVVAWLERPPTRQSFSEAHVFVQRWNGTSWQGVGDAVSGSWTIVFAGPPALAVDSTDRPVVAWYSVGGAFVYISRWEGQWQETGRLSNGLIAAAVASKPSLQLDGAGNPMVIWAQHDGYASFPPPTSDAYFGLWTGTDWALSGKLQARTESQTSVLDAVVSFGSAAQPIAAWSESNGTYSDLYVGRVSTGGWSPIGGALSAKPGTTGVRKPSLQVGPTGAPMVAWLEDDEGGTSRNLYVRRWSGTAWEPLGEGINANPAISGIDDPVLAADASGDPIVAWTGKDGNTTNIYVHHWADGQWVPVGGPLSANPGATGAAHPSLHLSPDGVPIVAWDEAEESPPSRPVRHVYVYRLNR